MTELRASAKCYDSYLKLDEPPESVACKDADEEWIMSVTGSNTSHRHWSNIANDEAIQPLIKYAKVSIRLLMPSLFPQPFSAGYHSIRWNFSTFSRVGIINDGDAWEQKTQAKQKNRLHN
jgi:hypothetical protein